MTTIGVLVMAYGGPDKLEDVEPYLMDVRGGRATSPAAITEVRERYREIGGRSPILERTLAQASALQEALDPQHSVFRLYTGMRHWHPYIKDVLAEMAGAGIDRAVGLVMAPHYSRMSVGVYYKKVDEVYSSIAMRQIEQWHLLPGYLDALVDHVGDALQRFPSEIRASVPIIFTAHSLPERILTWGDPYPGQLQATVAAVVERLGPFHGERHFAYQSAAMTPEPWLGPDVSKVIGQLAADGHENVLIAPIGFVCEHVEILYDIDVALQRQARTLGLHLERIEMLNTAPAMINGLADLVRDEAKKAGWL
ncbi:MAG: ferrochelatase [Chloroflexi bacterium]|nr:ferrochelatase [Chloroflexota bacterium]